MFIPKDSTFRKKTKQNMFKITVLKTSNAAEGDQKHLTPLWGQVPGTGRLSPIKTVVLSKSVAVNENQPRVSKGNFKSKLMKTTLEHFRTGTLPDFIVPGCFSARGAPVLRR